MIQFFVKSHNHRGLNTMIWNHTPLGDSITDWYHWRFKNRSTKSIIFNKYNNINML